MWLTLFFVAVLILAAPLAAWVIRRRKWAACVPAVVVGLWPFLPAELLAPIYDRAMRFNEHVEPRNLVMTWLLVDSAAVACLVALWAGWSRAHWFWRLSALAGVPAALSLVKANEPIALGFVVMPAIAATAWLMRRSSGRRLAIAAESTNPDKTRFRWQIRDVLLLFVPVGLVALAIRSLVAGPFYMHWEHFAALAAALVLLGLTAAAAGGATTSLWRWLSAAACAVLIAAATAVFIARDNDVLGLAYFLEQLYIGDVGSGLFLMAVVEIPVSISIITGIYRWSARPESRLPKAMLCMASAALATPLVIVGVMMLPPKVTVERLPPSPTYQRLIAAGERIRPLLTTGRPTAKLKPEINAVTKILEQPGHVWFDVETFASHELSRQYDLSFDALFQIVYSLEVEIARAEARGDFAESARLGELQLRLAKVMSKGGMRIHWGISRNAELRGRAAIDFAAPHLDADELAQLLAAVQEHDQSRVPLDTMLAYDDYWGWVAFGWRARFFQAARKLTGDRNVWITLSQNRLQKMRQSELASLRLLQTRLAIELYRRSNGELPDSLDQLVPEQLSEMRLDPWTDRPLIYRRNGDSFVLYSTWSDRKDNGGRFLTDMNQATDFGSDIGYDLDPGFDRRGNPWPRNDPTVTGVTPAAAPTPTRTSPTPASN
ncbi:MAG: hypothetical protein WEH44_04480 [Pirellulaceae bacterium]